ncbi:hypothetical protein [Cupriavidus sp. amp6]|uniref:hypothetical protein n=1 Tax=Cupriavidus sp. amp6 TaxID=388051 RepID=UPI0003FC7FEF|nr:hypothetical protein [Cupriavidus sp. amp6]
MNTYCQIMSVNAQELVEVRPRLRGDALLLHPLLDGTKEVDEALRLNHVALQPYVETLGVDSVQAVKFKLETQFEPTDEEMLFAEEGVEANINYLRARAVEGDFINQYDSQTKALMAKMFTPSTPPHLASEYSQVAIFSQEMEEARFARILESQTKQAIEIRELGGVKLFLHLIVALVVPWPVCGTLSGLIQRIFIAIDQALGSKLYALSRVRGVPQRSPESFIEVLLQIFNVGMIYVHGVNSDNVRMPQSNRCFTFLADVTKTTRIPVLLSGTSALLYHLQKQPASGSELLRNPYLEISSYSPEESSRVVKSYLEGLPSIIQERFCYKTAAQIFQKSEYQRRLFVSALTAAVVDAMTNSESDAKSQLGAADEELARHKHLLFALSTARSGRPISSQYRERYQAALPLSVKYIDSRRTRGITR